MRIRKTERYEAWITGLRDAMARARITRYFERVESGTALVGDLRPVGGHVVEVRFHFGPGYRVYLTQRGQEIVLLLVGGDKSSQRHDIETAKAMADEWRSGHAQD